MFGSRERTLTVDRAPAKFEAKLDTALRNIRMFAHEQQAGTISVCLLCRELASADSPRAAHCGFCSVLCCVIWGCD